MESKITPELIEQAKKAESVAALLALAKENGIGLTAARAEKLFNEWHSTKELSDEELDSVAGGCGSSGGGDDDKATDRCPECRSTDVEITCESTLLVLTCRSCGHEWRKAQGGKGPRFYE